MADLVDSAASFLLYEHNIELFRCKKAGEFAEYLHTLTRLIHHRVQAEVVTEIDCVSKYAKAYCTLHFVLVPTT